MKKSRKVLQEQLLQRWNHDFAPKKPSEKRIEKIKRYIKGVKKNRENFVEDQMELVKEQMEQEEVVRSYISDNRDEPGLAVSEASRQSFDVHRQR